MHCSKLCTCTYACKGSNWKLVVKCDTACYVSVYVYVYCAYMYICTYTYMHINAHICKGSSWKLVVKCVTQRDPTPAAGQQLPNNLLVLSSLVLCYVLCCVLCKLLCKACNVCFRICAKILCVYYILCQTTCSCSLLLCLAN